VSCPICDGEVVAKYRPFCSGRCADIDLAKWFNGTYAAPSHDPDDIETAIEATEAALNETQKPH
jgi:endogenous inhibitor of DNA gyrase (YacG/DUF329 family)